MQYQTEKDVTKDANNILSGLRTGVVAGMAALFSLGATTPAVAQDTDPAQEIRTETFETETAIYDVEVELTYMGDDPAKHLPPNCEAWEIEMERKDDADKDAGIVASYVRIKDENCNGSIEPEDYQQIEFDDPAEFFEFKQDPNTFDRQLEDAIEKAVTSSVIENSAGEHAVNNHTV